MNKDEQIRWMNSLTNASNLVSSLSPTTLEDAKEMIQDAANWFYRTAPQGSDLEAKIKACNNKEELDSLKEDVKKTDDKNIFRTFNDKILELNARESLAI